LVKVSGVYVIDDMLPQVNWSDGHEKKARQLLAHLQDCTDFQFSFLPIYTGIVLMTRNK
jgi:hypothetical protein